MAKQKTDQQIGWKEMQQKGWPVADMGTAFPAILDDGQKVMLTVGEDGFLLGGVLIEQDYAYKIMDRALEWAMAEIDWMEAEIKQMEAEHDRHLKRKG